jgi:hypothetical protein|tara:strand:- start:555 stop:896 length:342 start_codon:yes stop_codon:yes gene_type:complete
MSTSINITNLPQVTEINSDDLIFIQTPTSSNTIEFKNFVIGLENTTFGSTIINNSTGVNTLSTDLTNLSATFVTPQTAAFENASFVTANMTYITLTINNTKYGIPLSALDPSV